MRVCCADPPPPSHWQLNHRTASVLCASPASITSTCNILQARTLAHKRSRTPVPRAPLPPPAVRLLHERVFENYRRWVSMLDADSGKELRVGSLDSPVDADVLLNDLCLFYCIVAEGAHLRFMPECVPPRVARREAFASSVRAS